MRTPSSASRYGLALGLALLPAACGLAPPIQNSGAAMTKDGVRIAVLAETCSETVQQRQPGNDLVEAIVEVQIENPTEAPVEMHRDAFRLCAADGSAIRTSTWHAADPISVAPGQTQTFRLRFMSRGGLSCWREMELRPYAAVTRGAEPQRVGSIRFVPSRALPGYGAQR
jgi:hypothetical protein